VARSRDWHNVITAELVSEKPNRKSHAERHVPALDGLRGLAILLIYVLHYGGEKHQSPSRLIHAYVWLKSCGWIGVDLFFVLSGFLITRILIDTRSNCDRMRSFYLRRALRILPVFYGTALVLVCLTRTVDAHWTMGHVAYLVYAQNVAAAMSPPLIWPSRWVFLGHLWSLAVEEQFYLLWPFVVWKVSRGNLRYVCLALILGSAPLRWFVPTTVAYSIIRWDEFAMGALIALDSAGEYQRRFLMMAGLAFLGMAAIFGPSPTTRAMTSFGISAAGLMFSGMLSSVLQGGILARLCSFSWLRCLGRYSYGLYIFHMLWWSAFVAHLPRTTGGQVVWFAGTFAMNLGAAVFSFHLLETPFLNLKQRFESSSPRRLVAAATTGVAPAAL
jgi:peptidoglycan/LPS O-acetylase OafA/YrhL